MFVTVMIVISNL